MLKAEISYLHIWSKSLELVFSIYFNCWILLDTQVLRFTWNLFRRVDTFKKLEGLTLFDIVEEMKNPLTANVNEGFSSDDTS